MAEQNKNDDYQNKEDENNDTSSVPSDEVPTTPSASAREVVESDRTAAPKTPSSAEVTPQVTPDVTPRFPDVTTPESPGAVLDPSSRIRSFRDEFGAISLQLLLQRVRRGNTIGNSLTNMNQVPKTPPDWIRLDKKRTAKSFERVASIAKAAQEKDAARLRALLESPTYPLPKIDTPSSSSSDEDDVEDPQNKE